MKDDKLKKLLDETLEDIKDSVETTEREAEKRKEQVQQLKKEAAAPKPEPYENVAEGITTSTEVKVDTLYTLDEFQDAATFLSYLLRVPLSK